MKIRLLDFKRAYLMLALAPLAGCSMIPGLGEEEEVEPPVPITWEGEPLEDGTSTVFEFPADGKWHQTEVIAYNGDRLTITPTGTGKAVRPGAIRFRIANQMHVVTPNSHFVVTNPGQIGFMLDSRMASGYDGPIQVEITNGKIEEPEESTEETEPSEEEEQDEANEESEERPKEPERED